MLRILLLSGALLGLAGLAYVGLPSGNCVAGLCACPCGAECACGPACECPDCTCCGK